MALWKEETTTTTRPTKSGEKTMETFICTTLSSSQAKMLAYLCYPIYGAADPIRDSFCYLIHFYYLKAFSVFHLCSFSSQYLRWLSLSFSLPSAQLLRIAQNWRILSLVLTKYISFPRPSHPRRLLKKYVRSPLIFLANDFSHFKTCAQTTTTTMAYGLADAWFGVFFSISTSMMWL